MDQLYFSYLQFFLFLFHYFWLDPLIFPILFQWMLFWALHNLVVTNSVLILRLLLILYLFLFSQIFLFSHLNFNNNLIFAVVFITPTSASADESHTFNIFLRNAWNEFFSDQIIASHTILSLILRLKMHQILLYTNYWW